MFILALRLLQKVANGAKSYVLQKLRIHHDALIIVSHALAKFILTSQPEAI